MKEARLCSAFGEIHVFHRLWFERVPLYEYRDLRIRHTEGWKSHLREATNVFLNSISFDLWLLPRRESKLNSVMHAEHLPGPF